ncbi:MAG TPA: response regulator transcription factor [Acidimicrobiia bacterium]|nr:response regulator transcription factor [Acidimicrobiia bacterium]
MKVVRVLIVDDQEPFREAARLVVEMTDGFEVAGMARDGQEGVEMVAELAPDLVLMDVQMPVLGGIDATRVIAEVQGAPPIVVMSTHDSGDYREAALASGAMAFIPKSEFGMDTLVDLWQAHG